MPPPTNPTPPNDNPPAPPVIPPPPPQVTPEPSFGPPPTPQEKNRSFLQRWSGPKVRALTFAFIFAGLGGIFIYSSFAASVGSEKDLLDAFKRLPKTKLVKITTTANLTYNG